LPVSIYQTPLIYRMKDSFSEIYGVLGYPVKHSLSPLMHNAALAALRINAEYRLFEVAPEGLAAFMRDLIKNNIRGLNVTIPYKEKVLAFVELPEDSLHLKEVRAVNTVVLKNGKWMGFNTDIPGFLMDLERKRIAPENKSVALLGAGGASRAIAYALAGSGAKEISIYDIDKEKTQGVVSMIKKLFPGFDIRPSSSVDGLDIKNKDLLVNTTPVGMKESDPCLVKEGMLHKGLFVYDVIYNPAQTKLLKIAQNAGLKNSNGLGMLLYQGALSFAHFTGKEAPVEIMRQALEKGI